MKEIKKFDFGALGKFEYIKESEKFSSIEDKVKETSQVFFSLGLKIKRFRIVDHSKDESNTMISFDVLFPTKGKKKSIEESFYLKVLKLKDSPNNKYLIDEYLKDVNKKYVPILNDTLSKLWGIKIQNSAIYRINGSFTFVSKLRSST